MKIEILKAKRKLFRIWFGFMLAVIGLWIAMDVICDGVVFDMGAIEFFFRFFIGLCVMVLGGNVIWLADNID